VTAGVLLCVSLSGWLYHRAQLADIAADHLRLQITGPAKLQAGIDNAYSLTTTSVTGKPVSAQIEFALYSPDNERLMGHKEKTDEHGRLTVTIPADLNVPGGAKLEVLATDDGKQEKVVTRLSVEPVRYATYLAVDKPLYRPGETIRYRSVTLSRFRLAADREMLVRFEILDPGGAPVAGSQRDLPTRDGVASGEFRIPGEVAGGKYTLVARSVDGEFPDERRKFFVWCDRPPQLNATLEFTRDGYAPGDTVVADFSANRAEGAPAAGAGLRIAATVDGDLVNEQTAEASSFGTFRVEFALPEKIEHADGRLVVVADDGDTCETVARTIPINLGKADVSFYPEGGHLVAGLENRVYFAARDPFGDPVEVRGRIVDGQGGRVVGVATTHKGLGALSIVPLPGEEYRLELDGTTDAPQAARLPEVSSGDKVVLNTGLGVFQDGEPLEFNVRAAEAGLPLVASAWCRGVPVGQQVFVTKQDANPVAIPLADAGGVIRLTIYDYSSNPPEPVAERLVYRRPAIRPEDEQVDVDDGSERNAPAERTDTSVAAGAEDASKMYTHFLLATEVESTEDLDDSDSYLSDGREADVALDLLLGTQGWRRFLEEKLESVAEEDPDHERLLRLAALGGRANPPAMFDNLLELQERYKESLATYQARRTRASNTLTTLSFFGGMGLVVLVAMLNLLNIAGGARLWAPAIGVATVCLIIGGILMDPGRWKSAPEGAVAFVPFDMAPTTLPPVVDVPENQAADKSGEVQKPGDHVETAPTNLPAVGASDLQGESRSSSGNGEVSRAPAFRLKPRLPLEVSPGDRIDVPLGVVNQTDRELPVELVLEHGELVQLDGDAQRKLLLEARQRFRQQFSLEVVGQTGDCKLIFRGTADQLTDEVTCSLKVVPPEHLPQSGQVDADTCPVRLSTRLAKEKVRWGDTVALSAELTNTTDDGQPMTVAVVGLPAGLEVRPDQLERLKKAGKIDGYQTRPREIICSWRTLDPKEKVDVKLDVIAAVPGKYTGPASRAYLRDAAERKHVSEPLVAEITP